MRGVSAELNKAEVSFSRDENATNTVGFDASAAVGVRQPYSHVPLRINVVMAAQKSTIGASVCTSRLRAEEMSKV